MVSPVKLAHVVLWSKQVPRMTEWYRSVLAARVVYQNSAAAFLTYDDEHHRVAVTDPDAAAAMAAEHTGSAHGLIGGVEPPSSRPRSEDDTVAPPRGLSHIAFTYASLNDLLENYERLRKESITPTAAINHGTTTSLYYADPDQNQIELQVDNFDTVEESTRFMESPSFARNPVGVPVDPGALLKRLRDGADVAALIEPTW